MLPDRPLFSLEAEHGVLGALMHNPEHCETIGARLDGSHFHHEDNAVLYAMILACHSKQMRPDSITLSEIRAELPSGELTIVYASEIMRNVPGSANVRFYAKTVEQRYHARKLYETGERLMALAMSQGELAEQVSEAQAAVMALGNRSETPDVVSMREALGPVFEDMDERFQGTQIIGQDFGLTDLDKIVRMLRPGNLAIIAGRPGTGKTVLGMNLADRVAVRRGGASLVFSLEMSSTELARRSLACESEVRLDWLESGEALKHDDSNVRMTAAVSKLSQADIRICDKPGLTFARICSIARFQHRARPLDVIVVDYLSLIATDPNSKIQNRNLELGSYTRGFKALAKELKLPIVVLAQLNRGIENRADPKPKMSDLRDSGEIEQDADVIIMAHRDQNTDAGRNGLTEVDVVKVRHAKPDGCMLQFRGEYAKFVNAAHQTYDEPVETQQAPRKASVRSMFNDKRGSVAGKECK